MDRNVVTFDDADLLLDEVSALVDRIETSNPALSCSSAVTYRGNGEDCRIRHMMRSESALIERPSPRYSNRVDVSIIPCHVCGDRTSGTHYGVLTCEGCKGFFRRIRVRADTLVCQKNNDCLITKETRNRCQACRYRKCLLAGMNKDHIKFGRKSKQDQAELRKQASRFKRFSRNNHSSPPGYYYGSMEGSSSNHPPKHHSIPNRIDESLTISQPAMCNQCSQTNFLQTSAHTARFRPDLHSSSLANTIKNEKRGTLAHWSIKNERCNTTPSSFVYKPSSKSMLCSGIPIESCQNIVLQPTYQSFQPEPMDLFVWEGNAQIQY